MIFPKLQTLQEYLQAETSRRSGDLADFGGGTTDFSLRVSSVGDKIRFYLHPAHVDGQTIDFEVTGNNLVTTAVTDYARLKRESGETFG